MWVGWRRQTKPKGLSKIYEINTPKKLPDKISTPQKIPTKISSSPQHKKMLPPKISLNNLHRKKNLQQFLNPQKYQILKK
jgi:hypothetical protein